MSSIRLVDAAKKLKISRTDLVEILQKKGLFIENKYNAKLHRKHIEALASEYVRSVTKYYEAFKSNRKEIPEKKRNWLQRFFSQFTETDAEFIDYYAISACVSAVVEYKELDNSKIELYFEDYICGRTIRNLYSRFINGINRLKLKVQKKVLYLKSIILKILTPRLFYVYASEEDPNRIANNHFSFSFVTSNRKACLVINSKTKHFYEKPRYINQ